MDPASLDIMVISSWLIWSEQKDTGKEMRHYLRSRCFWKVHTCWLYFRDVFLPPYLHIYFTITARHGINKYGQIRNEHWLIIWRVAYLLLFNSDRKYCNGTDKDIDLILWNSMFPQVYSLRAGSWTISKGYKKSLKDTAQGKYVRRSHTIV